jgi:hypothetical protein
MSESFVDNSSSDHIQFLETIAWEPVAEDCLRLNKYEFIPPDSLIILDTASKSARTEASTATSTQGAASAATSTHGAASTATSTHGAASTATSTQGAASTSSQPQGRSENMGAIKKWHERKVDQWVAKRARFRKAKRAII